MIPSPYLYRAEWVVETNLGLNPAGFCWCLFRVLLLYRMVMSSECGWAFFSQHFGTRQTGTAFVWGSSSSYPITTPLITQKPPHWHTVLTHERLWMCPQWLGVTSVFRPPLSSDLLVCGEVLLFWSSALSRGVSSFGYGASWQGIFRYVYFEVITQRCFCLSDSMLLRSFILLSVRLVQI